MTPITATRTLSIAAAVLTAMIMSSFMEPVAAANRDVDALTALRKGLRDPDGALTNWDPSLVHDPCTWFHVTCDGANRVTRLDLAKHRLSGPLAPELGQLDQLQYLEIYGNNIQGQIPSELGGLTNLISLDLQDNSISGPIPAALGNIKSLKFLRVNHNRLTGPIPRELAGLPNLRVADFSSNNLCGTIPASGALKSIPPSRCVELRLPPIHGFDHDVHFAGNPRLHQGGSYVPNC
ncbi:Somatic embryogenesis receptor kinase 2 [Dichanthelium oligosanthes]|uniref:Somatic embryogenesis receptor kinase 2 n=1 Tax=Dichanthelium oligosanthes TaxID=888268 RepID=A0A1E5VTJ7_9POAL|nr:Somatic embryogenesis receptor kinase 2 [Dichanthelium oligosanthes]